MAVDDPTGFNASIMGEIKDIKRRLDELSATPIGKVKFATAWDAPVVSPVVTTTPSKSSTTVQVPALATSCGYSAFATGQALNTTAATGWCAMQIEVTYGSYDHYTFFTANNVPPNGYAALTVPQVDTFTFPPGGGPMTVTASIWVNAGSWTDTTQNQIFTEGLFVFQY